MDTDERISSPLGTDPPKMYCACGRDAAHLHRLASLTKAMDFCDDMLEGCCGDGRCCVKLLDRDRQLIVGADYWRSEVCPLGSSLERRALRCGTCEGPAELVEHATQALVSGKIVQESIAGRCLKCHGPYRLDDSDEQAP